MTVRQGKPVNMLLRCCVVPQHAELCKSTPHSQVIWYGMLMYCAGDTLCSGALLHGQPGGGGISILHV